MYVDNVDGNFEKSNLRFISYNDYSVSKKIYSPEEEERLENVKCRNGFFVDEAISQAISELNKKGYITKFSCGGHLSKMKKPIIVYEIKDILEISPERLKYLSPQYGYIKCAEDDNSISFLYKGVCSQPYILFAEDVELSSIPTGFYLDSDYYTNFTKTLIRANVVCCVEENGKLRFISDDEAKEQLRQIRENLLNWAINLSYKKTSSIQK